MADLEYPEPNSTLGERLLVGVRNLWARVTELQKSQQTTEKVVAHQGQEIEQIKLEVQALRSEIRGLKISRGKALAKNVRLLQQTAEAESGLSEIEPHVH
jgi:peptidoglycan hydrolase CwlO-like protein